MTSILRHVAEVFPAARQGTWFEYDYNCTDRLVIKLGHGHIGVVLRSMLNISFIIVIIKRKAFRF